MKAQAVHRNEAHKPVWVVFGAVSVGIEHLDKSIKKAIQNIEYQKHDVYGFLIFAAKSSWCFLFKNLAGAVATDADIPENDIIIVVQSTL